MGTLFLGENPLELADLAAVLRSRPPSLALDPTAAKRVAASRRAVERHVREGRTCYGVNTGFGRMANIAIPTEKLQALQVNLLRSHSAGVGAPLERPVSRLAFALRIANLARGYSGVRPALVDHALAVFNAGIVPVMPSQGSVGASGDLAPLAHMALVLIGEGRAWVGRKEVDGAAALLAAGLKPTRLASKEGLALINGTQVSTALLAEALVSARRLAAVADLACAMSLEAFGGHTAAFDERLHALRGHPGQSTSASNVRRIVEGSEILRQRKNRNHVQDPYSLRCAPQVHGASRDTLDHIEAVVLREAFSVTDNPIVLDDHDIVSGGNFHAEPVAMAADFLKVAAAELASISERRIELGVNPDFSGHAPFLAPTPGLESGLMMVQVAAAALVSENKVLSHPASVDSIPTSAAKEDHVSMATHGARQAREIVRNATNVLAIELMTAFHSLALEPKRKAGAGVEAARRVLRSTIKPLRKDRVLAGDIAAVAERIGDGAILAGVEKAVGALD